MSRVLGSRLEFGALNHRAVMLFIALLAHHYHSSARQVNGSQLQSQMNSSSSQQSLPSLTERATGQNSRYLSAGSTASLAAATLAAANQPVSPASSSSSSAVLTANGSQEASNRNFLFQQQHQNQNSPQLSLSQASGSLGGQLAPSQGQPQYNNVLSGSPLQLQQQPQLTPIMSTTFVYNPTTGQFVPSDQSTGLVSSQSVAAAQQASGFMPTQSSHSSFNYGLGNQASRFDGALTQQPLVGNPYNTISQLINQISRQQQQQQQQFNRRTGYSAGVSGGQRYGGIYGPSAGIEDELAGLFSQQQGSLAGTQLRQPDYNDLIGISGQPGSQQHHNQIFSDQQIVSQHQGLPLIPSTSSVSSTGSASGEQCVAADNRHGTCYQASECIRRGGTPMGKCGPTNSGPELPGSSSVCCLFDVTCGQFATERFVYFRNPNYPNHYEQSRMCRVKIGKLDKGICQFRLDLIRFDIGKPTNGNCSTDMFVVSGQNENYIIPKICGLNDGQHYYVGVDESGVITLHMMMMGYHRRQFEILVTQIPCRSDYTAPAHCLQYFMGSMGTIKSFNYDDDQSSMLLQMQQQTSQANGWPQSIPNDQLARQQHEANLALALGNQPAAPYGLQFGANGQLQPRQFNQHQLNQQHRGYVPASQSSLAADQYAGYPNDLDYTMCIRKESGFCSITYQLSRGEQGLQPFAVGQSSSYGALDGIRLNGSSGQLGDNPQSWNQVSTECRDDYLLIGGVRLCSGNGNGAQIVNLSPYDQFGQNSSYGSTASGGSRSNAGLLQQLQQQYGQLMQQWARLQQQSSANASISHGSNGLNLNQQVTGNGDFEQQQAAIMQQATILQHQINQLASASNGNYIGNSFGPQSFDSLQGAIITDTTSGPFILRFVSNLARNARGFHIDYRQNPCK